VQFQQAAFLAGLPQSPAVYDIYTNRDATLARDQQVLTLMVQDSYDQNCIKVSNSTEPVCVDPSAAANAAGIKAPYAGFTGTVAQALRPFPQYNVIDTYAGQGDHSGHSTYNAIYLKFQKRYSNGLTFQGSYAFSKLLTDSDSAWGNALGAGQGAYYAADCSIEAWRNRSVNSM